jgi:hypothetical protein
MLLEALDAEQFRTDRFFVIPWCSLRRAPEGAKDRRSQFGWIIRRFEEPTPPAWNGLTAWARPT